MRAKLTWVNRNTGPTTIAIYRNNEITPNAQLANPIANLSGTTTEYIDTDVLPGQTRYYVIALTSVDTTVYSAPIKVVMQYDTGPGPTALEYGDAALGYFGTCTHLEMFTSQEMVDWVNNRPGLGIDSVALPVWDKWIRNGKILYVPRSTLTNTIAYTTLYARGAVFGTDAVGPPQVTLPPVIQNARISRGYYTFKVRLMTGVDDRNNPTFIADIAKPSRAFSELSDLCYPRVTNVFPTEQRGRRHLSAVAWQNEFGGNTSTRIRCIEVDTTGSPLTMFTTNWQAAIYTDYSVYTNTAAAVGWKPVLELDQTDLVIKEVVL